MAVWNCFLSQPRSSADKLAVGLITVVGGMAVIGGGGFSLSELLIYLFLIKYFTVSSKMARSRMQLASEQMPTLKSLVLEQIYEEALITICSHSTNTGA